MPDLIAQGSDAQHRWRRPLTVGEHIVLGRDCGPWSAPWDRSISRQHAELLYRRDRLTVKRLPSGLNPIFVSGQEASDFELGPGGVFVIGDTTFTLAADQVNVSLETPQPHQEQAFKPGLLRKVRFQNADHRLDVLSRLPEVISGAANDTDLYVRLVNMLLAGIPRASAAALVAVDFFAPPASLSGTPSTAEGSTPRIRTPAAQATVEVLHWDRRLIASGDFQPSQRLILEAVRRQETVLHSWNNQGAPGPQFTLGDNVDWAFCTPVPGDACAGWGVYVAGRLTGEPGSGSEPESADLREDVKFTELVSATLGSLRQLRGLQRKHTTLSQFFAPAVLEAMASEDPEVVLSPRETNVSVLFCDLRGFSFEAERSADDLLGLLKRVSKALGVTTHHILDQGGVVGDFQGDAAMGFWNWPFAQADATQRAGLAALAVQSEFEAAARRVGHPLADFRMGIGLATGRAVAGRIGTIDQVKVTVFGPVVNLASRLEGMTKLLKAPIIIDEATARYVRQHMAPRLARTRRLAKVKPYGLDIALEVSELLPPEAECPELTDEHVAAYENALDAFLEGNWGESIKLLHRVPPTDLVKDFLMVFIAQRNRTPPPGWDGVIPLPSKS